jgi:hypothetical protein
MIKEGADPAVLDMDPNKPAPKPAEKKEEAEESEDEGPESTVPIKDMEDFKPYFKMLSMGLPAGAVKHKMQKDGKDPAVLDLDPNKPLPRKKKAKAAEPEEPQIPLKDMPQFAPYFKMLKMGLPKGAVKHKMTKEGLDPAVLDMDPEKPPNSAKPKAAGAAVAKKVVPKKRRKKLHWNTVADDRITENSIWATGDDDEIDFGEDDLTEMDSLFQASSSPNTAKAKPAQPKRKQVWPLCWQFYTA